MQSDFAPDYDRSEDGLVLFPVDDTQYRKELFPFWTEQSISLSEHPAKANLFLVQACVEYVSEPGETVMVTSELLAILDKEIDWCSH